MNAMIHSFDRLEPGPSPGRLSRLIRNLGGRFYAALRESRDRQALAHLSEWSALGLQEAARQQREAARQPKNRPLTDGRWLIEQTRRRERG
jgi:hypothetical protein